MTMPRIPPLRVSPYRAKILALLRERGGMPSTEIAKQMRPTSLGNVHRLLRALRDEGKLRARMDLKEGRANAIWYEVVE